MTKKDVIGVIESTDVAWLRKRAEAKLPSHSFDDMNTVKRHPNVRFLVDSIFDIFLPWEGNISRRKPDLYNSSRIPFFPLLSYPFWLLGCRDTNGVAEVLGNHAPAPESGEALKSSFFFQRHKPLCHLHPSFASILPFLVSPCAGRHIAFSVSP